MITLESFDAAASKYATLGDRSRLAILSLLATEKAGLNVSEIQASIARVTQPTISHHLRLLEDAGFITRQRNYKGGRVTLVKISKPGLKLVQDHLRNLVTPKIAAEPAFSAAE